MCACMSVYYGLHLNPSARVDSCLRAHRYFSLCVCVCGYRWLCGKPRRACGLEAAIDIVRHSLLSFGMWAVYVCGSKNVSVWGPYSQPQLAEGSERRARIPSTSFNKSHIVMGGSCSGHDNGRNNAKPYAMIRTNERDRFSIVLFHLLHFSDDTDDTPKQPWAVTNPQSVLGDFEKSRELSKYTVLAFQMCLDKNLHGQGPQAQGCRTG